MFQSSPVRGRIAGSRQQGETHRRGPARLFCPVVGIRPRLDIRVPDRLGWRHLRCRDASSLSNAGPVSGGPCIDSDLIPAYYQPSYYRGPNCVERAFFLARFAQYRRGIRAPPAAGQIKDGRRAVDRGTAVVGSEQSNQDDAAIGPGALNRADAAAGSGRPLRVPRVVRTRSMRATPGRPSGPRRPSTPSGVRTFAPCRSPSPGSRRRTRRSSGTYILPGAP